MKVEMMNRIPFRYSLLVMAIMASFNLAAAEVDLDDVTMEIITEPLDNANALELRIQAKEHLRERMQNRDGAEERDRASLPETEEPDHEEMRSPFSGGSDIPVDEFGSMRDVVDDEAHSARGELLDESINVRDEIREEGDRVQEHFHDEMRPPAPQP